MNHRFPLFLAFLGTSASIATAQDLPIDAGAHKELDNYLREKGIDPEASRERFQQKLKEEKEEARKSEAESTVRATTEEPVPAAPAVPIYWPEDAEHQPLSVEEKIEITDGLPEKNFYFTSGNFRFKIRALGGVQLTADDPGASAVFTSRLIPGNRMEFHLFPSGSWLPSVSEQSLRSYLAGLAKTHEENIKIPDGQELIPGYTFKIDNQSWGKVNYRLLPENTGETEETEVLEYFIPLAGRQMIVRLSGNPNWVRIRSEDMETALSGLQVVHR